MTKEKLIQFIKNNYCNIEAISLPKVTGSLPPEKRLLKKGQLVEFINKARTSYGNLFAEFLEINTTKGSVPYGKYKLSFFWLDEDNWDSMYDRWQRYRKSH